MDVTRHCRRPLHVEQQRRFSAGGFWGIGKMMACSSTRSHWFSPDHATLYISGGVLIVWLAVVAYIATM
jgi:hypothetical protein